MCIKYSDDKRSEIRFSPEEKNSKVYVSMRAYMYMYVYVFYLVFYIFIYLHNFLRLFLQLALNDKFFTENEMCAKKCGIYDIIPL